MFRSLFRLKSFLVPYRGLLALGIFAFLLARIFEAAVPLFLKKGIDTIAAGSGDVLIPVLGIIASVVARFLVVTQARILVRRVGLNVAFDLRAQLYAQLQRQGARFFSQFTIGDMMTRAIADISLVQRLISMGSILLVVLVFATGRRLQLHVVSVAGADRADPAAVAVRVLLRVVRVARDGRFVARRAGPHVRSRHARAGESVRHSDDSGDGAGRERNPPLRA